MFRKLARAAAVFAACAALAGVQAGTAHATGPAVLGGGSGIIVNDLGVCTLTTIGHDAAGRLVGITAGHCNDAGTTVVADANRDAGVVGNFAYSNPDMDYAVIVFDPDKVVPVNRIGNTTITGLGGPAQFPDIACKEGYTTGQTCGLAYGDVYRTNTWTWTQICVLPGDSGAPVVVGTTLVGMVNGYLRVPCLGPELGANIAAIMEDVNARGDIGAGFHPI
ncbi:S1 family peptidase [Nocardia anaemiae]|uniref:S1 family peptidase n=1 Tax=Nocardia anaemiae TaxID=263910 RepID=UPI0007A3FAE2|nr:S1 family peptidase [Nocardia anaemiae]